MSGTQLFGAYIAYRLVKQLSTPWEEWEAYKLGLIDDKGKTLRKAKTKEEKNAMTFSQVLIKNLKKLLDKLPFGKTKFGSIAASLFLLKEHYNIEENEEEFISVMLENINIDRELTEEYNEDVAIPAGLYANMHNESVYHITEFLEPEEVFLGVGLYKVQDIKTREYTYVSEDDLRKI